jgi:hypothetical protein
VRRTTALCRGILVATRPCPTYEQLILAAHEIRGGGLLSFLPLVSDNQAVTAKADGASQALQVPDKPGHTASMDLIVGLPRSQSGKTAILVIVDRLSKCVALEPCLDKSSAVELAHVPQIMDDHGLRPASRYRQ